MTEQTEVARPWVEGWARNIAPLIKTMFPGAPGASRPGDAKSPVEEHVAALNDTWKQSIQKWSALAKEGTRPEALTPEALRELFTPARWSGPGTGAFDAGLREVLEGPKFATLWNMDREILQLQQRATERDKLVTAYHSIVQKAWNKAFERFSASFVSSKSEPPTSWRGLADRWLAVANEVLIEAHRSDEFIEAQTRMLRASSDYRLQERRLAEGWCAVSHIPTRTEMDDMQRVVTELRRELRLLRRQTAASVATSTGPAAAPRPLTPAPKQRTGRAALPKLRATPDVPATRKTRRTTKA